MLLLLKNATWNCAANALHQWKQYASQSLERRQCTNITSNDIINNLYPFCSLVSCQLSGLKKNHTYLQLIFHSKQKYGITDSTTNLKPELHICVL